MDIAKYISLYLLKNNFCYIHGLGNLEIKKKPATYDGQVLNAPVYDVQLTTGGSIDDSLANFIATHEQTSISKAANALRDFSIATRSFLQEGKEVEIPSLGKFTQKNGVVLFISDPNLQYTPPSVPVLKTAKRLEEAPNFKMVAPEENSYSSTVAGMNWNKIAMVGGLVVVLSLIAFFAVRFINNRKAAPAVATEQTVPDTATQLHPPVPTPPVDTTAKPKDTLATAPATAAPADNGQKRVILGTYPTRAAAEKRLKFLTTNGNKVELMAKDSSNYFVVMPITFAPADSAKTLDSLRRMFNPKGVSVYR